MFRTLYSKLAITLFIILCVIGVILLQLLYYSSGLYQAEVAQKLNVELANHIVADNTLIKNNKINKNALENVFHMLMVINPTIELYLLDTNGTILGFSAPPGKVVRKKINLEPIKYLISGNRDFPLFGEDPRNESRNKVFSASEIKSENILEGYLYIILASEKYEGVADKLDDSYIFRLSLWGLLAGIIAVFLIGAMSFSIMTRRLRKLNNAMTEYSDREIIASFEPDYEVKTTGGDEVDHLGRQFLVMVNKINSQMGELKKVDNMRRELVANVSHDLRTPITTLQGYIETLIIKGKDLSEQERGKYLKVALDYCLRLSQLVTELFELSKLDSCESILYAEPFSISDLIQDVVQKFYLRAKNAGIDLCCTQRAGAAMVYGDIAMLQRALENLIENALRHTTKGDRVAVDYLLKDGKVVVQVQDTGCGIPQTELNHIFDRFYQVEKSRENGEGSGLGLAITKRILELHGSTIQVQSKINSGTTFTFYMPNYKAA
ncbi:MAG: ATP-binding protein [Thiohalomonadales bacterium]